MLTSRLVVGETRVVPAGPMPGPVLPEIQVYALVQRDSLDKELYVKRPHRNHASHQGEEIVRRLAFHVSVLDKEVRQRYVVVHRQRRSYQEGRRYLVVRCAQRGLP